LGFELYGYLLKNRVTASRSFHKKVIRQSQQAPSVHYALQSASKIYCYSGAIEDVHCRQRLGKHVPAATNTQAIIKELLETVFSVGSAPRLYNEHPRPTERIIEKRWQLLLGLRELTKTSAWAAVTREPER
jgi:hypothetical protein